MSIQANKAIARQFCELFNAGEFTRVLDLMADDVNYWILVGVKSCRARGLTRKRNGGIFAHHVGTHARGLQVHAQDHHRRRRRIAMEAESYGKLKNGRVYNNQYHIRMRMRDGKIAEAREYLDTQHVYEVWFAP